MVKKNTLIVAMQILFVIILALYLIARGKGLAVFLFWPIIICIIWASLVLMFFGDRRVRIISLVILSVAMSSIPLVVVPGQYAVGVDGAFESQFASIIIEEGRWNPSLGSGFAQEYYGYNPALHFILSFSSVATGIEPHLLLKYFFLIFFRVVIVLLVLLIIESMILRKRNHLAFLATLIFVGSAGMAFMGVTRRTTACVFLLLSVYSIIKAQQERKILWNALFMVFSLMTVIANHSIAFYLFAFLLGAWIFSRAYALFTPYLNLFSDMFYKVAYLGFMIGCWELLVARVFLQEDLMYMGQILKTIMGGSGAGSLLTGLTSTFGISIYRPYELLIVFAAQMLFMALGALGLVLFAKRLVAGKQHFSSTPYFLLYFGIFGLFMFAISAFFMKTGLDVAVVIMLWFFCLPISIFAAYSLEGLARKLVPKRRVWLIACFVMLLFCSSLLLGMHSPRITNRAPGVDITVETDSRAITPHLFFAGKWLEEHSDQGSKVLGDFNMFVIFSGFFSLDVNSDKDYLSLLYSGNQQNITSLVELRRVEFGSYAHTLSYDALDYLVTNRAFSRYSSNTFGGPLNEERLHALGAVEGINKIYDNAEIQIYRIER